jgi:putative SOS response-associated peptidase YedK
MCTKAVSVNVREMSGKLKAPFVAPRSKPSVDKRDGMADTLPTDFMPVITLNRPREIQYMKWGLIPAFVSHPAEASAMFNARSETLLEKPSFRNLVMSSRCLILDEGFYEREMQGDEKVEWLVAPGQEDYFYKAGLWTTWRSRDGGEIIESFTMITCDPGETRFRKIHDRIPIIMNKEQRRLWMNPNARENEIISLLQPCADDMLLIIEHSRELKKSPKKKNNGFNEDLFN